MRKLLYILAVLVALSSCRVIRPGSTTVDSVYTQRTVTVHDTTLLIQADSSLYSALIECDSLGQARLKEINRLTSGTRSSLTTLTLTPRTTDNLLEWGCKCDSLAIYQAMYKIIESTHETRAKVETITVEVNKLTWWQQTQIYGFRVLAGILLTILILNLIKTWLNPTSLLK
jgi:hypothetical protein